MNSIFDKTRINHLSFKNRIFRSATWEDMADKNGNVTSEMIDLYRELAMGGVGTIITGMTSIAPNDGMLPGLLKFSDDSYVESNRQLTDVVHQYDCNIIMQAAIVDFCKSNDYGMSYKSSINELTKEDIKYVAVLFKDAAVRAKKAGYDGIQIHAAHHWFLSKFISPIYNQRRDEYGGSPENRAKILIDVLKSMRAAVGDDYFITIKINCDDFMEGGLTIDDSLVTCRLLSQAGIDAIEVSGNCTSRTGVKIKIDEGYFRDHGVYLKQFIDKPIILVGGHRSIESMNEILNETNIEYLSISRPLIREPNLLNRWKAGDLHPSICISCNNCYHSKNHKCVFTTIRQ